jgi:hypothetical protein
MGCRAMFALLEVFLWAGSWQHLVPQVEAAPQWSEATEATSHIPGGEKSQFSNVPYMVGSIVAGLLISVEIVAFEMQNPGLSY